MDIESKELADSAQKMCDEIVDVCQKYPAKMAAKGLIAVMVANAIKNEMELSDFLGACCEVWGIYAEEYNKQ